MFGRPAKSNERQETSADYMPKGFTKSIEECASTPSRHLRSVFSSSSLDEEPATSASDSRQTSGHFPKIVRNSLYIVVLLLLAAGIFKLKNVRHLADDVTGKGPGMAPSGNESFTKKKTITSPRNSTQANQPDLQAKSESTYKSRKEARAKKTSKKKSYIKKTDVLIKLEPHDTGVEILKADLKNSFKLGGWQ